MMERLFESGERHCCHSLEVRRGEDVVQSLGLGATLSCLAAGELC